MKHWAVGSSLFFVLGSLFLTWFGGCAAAQTGRDWWYVSVSTPDAAGDQRVGFIDVGSIVSNGRRSDVWTRVYNVRSGREIVGRSVALIAHHCATGQVATIQYTEYTASGDVVATNRPATLNWTYVVPETVGDAEHQFVCGDEATREFIGVRIGTLMALEDAAMLFAGP